MGALKLEGLRPGEFRYLEKEEVEHLLSLLGSVETGVPYEVKEAKKSRVGWARAKKPVRGHKGGGRGAPEWKSRSGEKKPAESRTTTAKRVAPSRSGGRGAGGGRPVRGTRGGTGRGPGGRKRDDA
jgi:hypothetical protein